MLSAVDWSRITREWLRLGHSDPLLGALEIEAATHARVPLAALLPPPDPLPRVEQAGLPSACYNEQRRLQEYEQRPQDGPPLCQSCATGSETALQTVYEAPHVLAELQDMRTTLGRPTSSHLTTKKSRRVERSVPFGAYSSLGCLTRKTDRQKVISGGVVPARVGRL